MKIALLTYFAADNYGAVLQTYATIKALEQCGNEVEIVNFVIPESPRPWLKKMMLYPKHLKLEKFRRNYFKCISKPYKTLEALQKNPPNADCYLVGSDQTWNPELSKDKAKGFFLDFGDESILRASYASSFGMSEWENTNWINKEDAKRLLHNFRFVSVRENSGLRILSDLFNVKKAVHVADPVMLFNDYSELIGNVISSNEIVLYKFINSESFYIKSKAIGKRLHLPVRSVGSIRRIKGVICSYPESLHEWLRRIASAKFVMTDSFHGTVLSLLYGKQFVVCTGNPKRITRLISLLEMLDLSDRYVQDTDSADVIMERLLTPINYHQVNSKIEDFRQSSFKYIESISASKISK